MFGPLYNKRSNENDIPALFAGKMILLLEDVKHQLQGRAGLKPILMFN